LLTVAGTIDGFTRIDTRPVVAAPVAQVRLGVAGSLSATASSAIAIKATLDVSSDGVGVPSKGTPVTFTAVTEPDGAIGYLGDLTVLVGDGSTVQTTYIATAAVTSVSFTATAQVDGQPPVTSLPIAVAR